MIKVSWFVIALGCFASAGVHASSISFRCKFEDGFVTTFKDNTQRSKRANDVGDLVFDRLDLKSRTGRLVGNSGVADVSVIEGDGSINIIEQTQTGNINFTTIFLTAGGTNVYPVVHSRHVNLGSSPMPSQYVGFCKTLS